MMKAKLFPGYLPLGEDHYVLRDRTIDALARYTMFLRWQRYWIGRGYDLQEPDFCKHWIKLRYVLYGFQGHFIFNMLRLRQHMERMHIERQVTLDLLHLLEKGARKRKLNQV